MSGTQQDEQAHAARLVQLDRVQRLVRLSRNALRDAVVRGLAMMYGFRG